MKKDDKTSMPPLSHITVLDMSRVLAGPWATQNLADLGATVIKVERPERGDDTRSWGPPYLSDEAGEPTSESGYYLAANRGKQSICVDITTVEGQARLHRLALKADVLVENFLPGTLARYQLGPEQLLAVNPRLVYCSITGFGQTGPLKDKPGYDYMMQAMGGLMSITGAPDEEGGEPMRVGIPIADLYTGMVATQAILGALIARDTPDHPASGKGQHIDLALFDCQLAMLANQGMASLLSGSPPERIGNCHPMIVPYQLCHTADRPIVIAVGNDRQFGKLCEVLQHPEWAGDERFATNPQRVAHRGQLLPLLEAALLTRTAEEWLVQCDNAGIPCGPVLTITEAQQHPQTAARGMIVQTAHPAASHVPLMRSPINYSLTTLAPPSAPPLLGQHDDEVG